MKERPILFSTDMIRAIPKGTTQTRRTRGLGGINKYPNAWRFSGEFNGLFGFEHESGTITTIKCPYGQAGDRLWVRETWRYLPNEAIENPYASNPKLWYLADFNTKHNFCYPWKPSIHMPRWASRFLLEKTSDRPPERLQEISFEDCLSEGLLGLDVDVIKQFTEDWVLPCADDKVPVDELADELDSEIHHIFMKYWDFLNAKRGYGWDTNPWVWVIEFTQIKEGV